MIFLLNKTIYNLLLISLLMLFFHPAVLGQINLKKNNENISFSYDRNSLSVIMLNYQNHKLPKEMKANFNPKVNQKFFFNPIFDNQFSVDWKRPLPPPPAAVAKMNKLKENAAKKNPLKKIFNSKGDTKEDNTKKEKAKVEKPIKIKESEKIRQALEARNIGYQIIKHWSQQNSKGQFPILKKRADYNYTTKDDLSHLDPKKIANIKPLFFKNYIMVFDFQYAGSLRHYYRKKKIKSDDIPDGVGADLNIYFYKLDIDNQLFELYIKPNFNNQTKLQEKKYPITLVREHNVSLTKIRPHKDLVKRIVPDSELYEKMIQDGIEDAVFHLERKVDDFQAKDMVYKVSPTIQGTIGKREDVKIDQRFYVYEKKFNSKTKKIETKRIAMLRASHKIGNNLETLKDSMGNYITTDFRKIYGKKVEEGMLIVQKKDLRVSVAAGTFNRSSNYGFALHAAYNLSTLLHPIKRSYDFSGSRIFIDLSFDKRPNDNPDSSIEKPSATRFGIGLSKDLLLNNIIDVSPYLGYYSYSVEDRDYLSSSYWKLGVRAPINIYYNTFLIADVGVTTEKKSTNVNRFPVGLMLRVDF